MPRLGPGQAPKIPKLSWSFLAAIEEFFFHEDQHDVSLNESYAPNESNEPISSQIIIIRNHRNVDYGELVIEWRFGNLLKQAKKSLMGK